MLDSEKTVFLRFNNTIVLIAGIYHSIAIEPKDSFGNVTTIDQSKLNIEIRKVNEPLLHMCMMCLRLKFVSIEWS